MGSIWTIKARKGPYGPIRTHMHTCTLTSPNSPKRSFSDWSLSFQTTPVRNTSPKLFVVDLFVIYMPTSPKPVRIVRNQSETLELVFCLCNISRGAQCPAKPPVRKSETSPKPVRKAGPITFFVAFFRASPKPVRGETSPKPVRGEFRIGCWVNLGSDKVTRGF